MSVQHNHTAVGAKSSAPAHPAQQGKGPSVKDEPLEILAFSSCLLTYDFMPQPSADTAVIATLQRVDSDAGEVSESNAILAPPATSIEFLLGQAGTRPLDVTGSDVAFDGGAGSHAGCPLSYQRRGRSSSFGLVGNLQSGNGIQNQFAASQHAHGKDDPKSHHGIDLAAPQGGQLIAGEASSLLEKADAADFLDTSRPLDMLSNSALVDVVLGANSGARMFGFDERVGNTSRTVGGSVGIDGVYASPLSLRDLSVDASQSGSTTEFSVPLEMDIAETVSYWVTQGIQNAELTIDGVGSDPVAVSIFLKGGEAHIGFRTDQPEIRQLLQGTLAHLKEMLGQEGLVLSDVTFGSSGSGGGGPRDRRESQGRRQTAVSAAVLTSQPGFRPSRPDSGRSLDVFV